MWLVRMNIRLSLVGPKLEAGIKIREAEVINQVWVILGQMLQEIAIYFSIVCLIAGWISGLVAAAKLLQSCLTLFDPVDGSPPGSSSLVVWSYLDWLIYSILGWYHLRAQLRNWTWLGEEIQTDRCFRNHLKDYRPCNSWVWKRGKGRCSNPEIIQLWSMEEEVNFYEWIQMSVLRMIKVKGRRFILVSTLVIFPSLYLNST